MSDFASRVAQARVEAGLTQQELGDLIGVDPSYISQVECRHREPSLHNFRKLVKGLQVSADLLLGL